MSLIDDVRDWVGSTPDDATITAHLGDLDDDVHLTAARILRRRRADMVANPAKWSVDGDWSQETAKHQFDAIDEMLRRLGAITGDPTDEPAGLPTIGQGTIAPRFTGR